MSKTYSVCTQCHSVNRFSFEKARDAAPRCGQCKGELSFHDGVSDVDWNGLQALLRTAELPVVLDLWAPWCGPCLGFAPVYQKVASERGDSMIFLKIDTEKFPEASQRLGVRGIPTLILFKQGQEVKRQAGAMPEAMFRQWLTS